MSAESSQMPSRREASLVGWVVGLPTLMAFSPFASQYLCLREKSMAFVFDFSSRTALSAHFRFVATHCFGS